jgi:hypothetical protein
MAIPQSEGGAVRLPASIIALTAVLAGAGCSGSDSSGPPNTSVPQAVQAAISGGTVRLTWNPVPGAIGYKVYMAEVGGVTRLNVTTLAGNMSHPEPAATFLHPAGLAPTTKFYFVVTAIRADSTESAESCEVTAKIATNEVTGC